MPACLAVYIVARLTKVLKEREKMNRTALATQTGLPYDRLVKYLAWMSDRNLVELDSNDLVCLTDTGRETYDRLVE
jgi:predicted transcriptional regulator